ncbi:hypothetical protein C0991_007488 [Blastosporella zonata]|nr:hypothetical protein C0991_007488 [Blastosporella zonata]
MGPTRRSSSYVSPTPQTALPQPPVSPLSRQSTAVIKPTGTGMTPASRYQHNLKVLRRRDPSISSIFDQFSHVCLYHHNGTKWEKQGYEGSMFLYERESYPPYGFYILNRMGSEDHIQRLYPEDNIGAHGSYLIIRSYPEYTDRRLAAVRASHDIAALDKFSDAYVIPNVDTLSANQKGEAQTIGLWMFTTDSREPLIDIFTRLHSYIKRNLPYPQEFRYGPDRPPPSNPASATNQSQANGHPSLPPTPSGTGFPTSPGPGQAQFQARHPSQSTPNGGLSELDKLFAKMEPTPLLAAAQATTHMQYPTSSSNVSVHSLLAGLGGGQKQPTSNLPSPPPSGSMNSSGLSLLDSIFASASNVGPPALPIQAPAPTTTAAPQVLDQTTLHALLGLPPSRTASAASTAYSTDARSSHSSSREGDNEGDDDTSDWRGATSDGYSESSTVLDPDAEYDDELQAAGASAGRPLLAEPAANGHGQEHGGRNGHGRVHGDVTPRPPVNGFITPPFGRQHRQSSMQDSASVAGRRQHQRQQQQQHPERTPRAPLGSERVLVPFEPDSELWPYGHNNNTTSTTTTNNNNNDHRNDHSTPSDDEIIELDFADTSALSDPEAFRVRPRTNGLDFGHAHPHNHGASNETIRPEKRVRTKRKQNRKEKEAKEREEIERSWDVPSSNNNVGGMYNYNEGPPSEPASPVPCPSPSGAGNGAGGSSGYGGESRIKNDPALERDDPQPANGTSRSYIKGAATLYPEVRREHMAEAVKDTMVSAVGAKGDAKGPGKAQPVLERNDFVREVLELIHTDKSFVDSLYKEYTSRVG